MDTYNQVWLCLSKVIDKNFEYSKNFKLSEEWCFTQLKIGTASFYSGYIRIRIRQRVYLRVSHQINWITLGDRGH